MPWAEHKREVVKQILSYFVRNPNAADNIEGITRWRLLEEQVHRQLQETQAALSWLIEQGLLQEVKTPGTAPIFRLNLEKRGDAIAFLEKKGQDQG